MQLFRIKGYRGQMFVQSGFKRGANQLHSSNVDEKRVIAVSGSGRELRNRTLKCTNVIIMILRDRMIAAVHADFLGVHFLMAPF